MLEMGGKIAYEERRDPIGEPIADLVVKASKLNGAAPPARRAPAMIDEFPILAVVAAFAQGETRIVGAAELRVKESDRITMMVEGLRACGVDAEELEDGLVVRGHGPKSVRGGAQIRTLGRSPRGDVVPGAGHGLEGTGDRRRRGHDRDVVSGFRGMHARLGGDIEAV